MSETDIPTGSDIAADPKGEARLDAEAERDLAAGRTIPHAEVVAWLESWGGPNELPCPEPPGR